MASPRDIARIISERRIAARTACLPLVKHVDNRVARRVKAAEHGYHGPLTRNDMVK